MPFYLSAATGLLHGAVGDGPHGWLGTCACYQRRDVLLTAAHCVPDEVQDLAVVLPGDGSARGVLSVVRHPTSDLAVLFAERRRPESMAAQVFAGVDETLVEGGDFLAFGYPVEGVQVPVGRLFKGHYQRHMSHTDSAGRGYFAGELSVAAPAGLSGGPVARPHTPNLISSVVTTNVESYAVLDYVEEVERDGRSLRLEARRVVAYGIAAMLMSAKDWLSAVCANEGHPVEPSTDGATWRRVGPPGATKP